MKNVLNCSGHALKIPNIVNSEGVYLFDDNGKQYMDLESGVWCTALGHKNPRINKIIGKQINSTMHAGFCYSNNILDESAKSVLSITNLQDGKCVFLCSGSEAIDILRQISRHVTGKDKTLAAIGVHQLANVLVEGALMEKVSLLQLQHRLLPSGQRSQDFGGQSLF